MSCPICQKERDPRYRPFCSKRCADVDLAHWLRGSYAIPDHAASIGEDDEAHASGFPENPH